jgi:hypothetical protein
MRAAIAAGAVAFLARLTLLVALPRAPVVSDAALYDRIARQLAGVYPGPPIGGFYRGFGYPLFLSTMYAVRPSYLGIRVVQALLWGVAVGLAVAIADRLFGARAAIVAAALALLQVVALPHFLFLLAENLLVVELVAATAVLIFLSGRRPLLAAVMYGGLLGAMFLTHLGWQIYPLFGLPLLWSRRLIGLGAATCLIVIVGTLVPLHLMYPGQPWQTGKGNRGYGGGSAWTFYVGTRTGTNGRPTASDYSAAERRLHSDSYYWHKGFENITRAPAQSLALWFGKQWRLWGTGEREPSSGSHAFDRAIDNVGKLVNGLIFGWAVVGLLALVLGRVVRPGMILAMPVIYAALLFPTFTTPEGRYAFAPELLLVVPAALALIRLRKLIARTEGALGAQAQGASSATSAPTWQHEDNSETAENDAER